MSTCRPARPRGRRPGGRTTRTGSTSAVPCPASVASRQCPALTQRQSHVRLAVTRACAQAMDRRGQQRPSYRALCVVRTTCSCSLRRTLACAASDPLTSRPTPRACARFQDTYAGLPAAMQREACRYLYLHQFGGAARPALARPLRRARRRAAAAAEPAAARPGAAAGVYADLSTVPLHGMEPLIKAHPLALASIARDLNSSNSLSTSWLASSRRHPFWLFTFAQMIRASGGDLDRHAPAATACSSARGVLYQSAWRMFGSQRKVRCCGREAKGTTLYQRLRLSRVLAGAAGTAHSPTRPGAACCTGHYRFTGARRAGAWTCWSPTTSTRAPASAARCSRSPTKCSRSGRRPATPGTRTLRKPGAGRTSRAHMLWRFSCSRRGARALGALRALSSAPAQCAVSAQRSFVCICNVGTYRRAQPEGLPCQACACQAL